MSNIRRGSKLLWVHCIMTWIVSLLVYSVRAPSICEAAAGPASLFMRTVMKGKRACMHAYFQASTIFRASLLGMKLERAVPAGADGAPLPGLPLVQLLWKYSRGAVGLRLRYLQQCEGAEARSVLVQDIPGPRPP